MSTNDLIHIQEIAQRALQEISEIEETSQEQDAVTYNAKNFPVLYLTKSGLAKLFSISRPTVYKYIDGIENQIKEGRYNQYAILDDKISIAVFADYYKYKKWLDDKNMKKYVPIFNLQAALDYLQPKEQV